MKTRRSPFFYGWIVVAITFLAAITAAGIRSAPAVFIHPLETEFGWSRAGIAGAISVNLLLIGLGAPFIGRLVDRFGPRRVIPCTLAVLCCAVLAASQMTEIWQLTAFWGILVGLGASGGSVVATTTATRWFVARRGLVIGFLQTANSTGQLIFIPLLMTLVVTIGWRSASLALAVIALVVLVPVVLLLRDDPSDIGEQAYGAGSAEDQARRAAAETTSVSLTGALSTPEFWLLAGSFFTCGATANGLIGTHLIPHSIDHGIPEVTAAATVGVMGGMNFFGTIASGWLTDRYDPRKLLAFYFTFRGLSLFVLPFVTSFPGLLFFAIPYGLDWFATVPPTAALSAKLFGRKSLGVIYGWIFFAHQVGAATAALGSGLIRDWLGDYQMAFLAGGMLCMVGAGLALLIRLRQQTPSAATAAAAAA